MNLLGWMMIWSAKWPQRFGFHSCKARAAAPKASLKLPNSESTTSGGSCWIWAQNSLAARPSWDAYADSQNCARIVIEITRDKAWYERTRRKRSDSTLAISFCFIRVMTRQRSVGLCPFQGGNCGQR